MFFPSHFGDMRFGPANSDIYLYKDPCVIIILCSMCIISVLICYNNVIDLTLKLKSTQDHFVVNTVVLLLILSFSGFLTKSEHFCLESARKQTCTHTHKQLGCHGKQENTRGKKDTHTHTHTHTHTTKLQYHHLKTNTQHESAEHGNWKHTVSLQAVNKQDRKRVVH